MLDNAVASRVRDELLEGALVCAQQRKMFTSNPFLQPRVHIVYGRFGKKFKESPFFIASKFPGPAHFVAIERGRNFGCANFNPNDRYNTVQSSLCSP
jgi:hypothetical protein